MFNLSKFKKQKHLNGTITQRVIWYLVSWVFFENKIPFPSKFRAFILRAFGAKVGIGFVIKPRVKIKYPWNLVIGSYVWIGENCWLDNLDLINISDNVCISQDCLLETGSHDFKSDSFELITREIYIDSNTWIGCRSLILPGTHIQKGSIFFGGSIISKKSNPDKVLSDV